MFLVIYHEEGDPMLSGEVYETLLARLMDGELLPGQLINRRDIAAQLGTSTAPVLEAMKQLEFDGYLETLPRKGTQVRLISEEDVLGNYVLRVGIECMAVRMSIAAGTLASHREELLALADEDAEALRQYGDARQRWRADIAYHTALVDTCGNRKLIEEYRRVALPNIFYRAHFYIRQQDDENATTHRDLTKALLAASPEEAEQLIRTHITAGKPLICRTLGMADER